MSKPRVTIAVPPWCGYAVDDPDQPGRLTAWWTDDTGAMRGYPTGTRWEPLPPQGTYGVDREIWYSDTYWPWKYAVADAILADPETAAARFRAAYPHAVIARTVASVTRTTAEADRHRRKYEAITAASMRRRGAFVADVARHLGLSWATTRTRITAGETLLTEDPDEARRFVAEYLRRLLEDNTAERLAATLLDGTRFDAARDDTWTHALSAWLKDGER